jgi:hypothetical protein
MAVTVTIDEDELLDMLMDRVSVWTTDDADLFEKMYDNRIWGGCFEGADLDIKSIVDNDYVNNTSIITREDEPEEWDNMVNAYNEGERYVNGYCIEAMSDDEERMLVSN